MFPRRFARYAHSVSARGLFIAILILSCSPASPRSISVPGIPASERDYDASVAAKDASVDVPRADAGATEVIAMCEAIGCADHATITATLRVSARELAQAAALLCIGPECIETERPVPIEGVDSQPVRVFKRYNFVA